MYKALVIGCGNIGAMYDFNNENILTHAKALHLNPEFNLTVFDINKAIAKEVSDRYKCNVLDSIDIQTLSHFDCVSICTPTSTHLELLEKAIDAGVKIIICEKPISNVSEELKRAMALYSKGNSGVLVNYIRRFQPAFVELKDKVSELIKNEELTNISIRYQRGFMNNCSHAFDLIEFLTDSEIDLTEIKKHNSIPDHFPDDPTVSLNALWNKTNINILGLSNIKFSHFEIDLYFTYTKISISEAGQTIKIFKAEEGNQFFKPLNAEPIYIKESCLKDYMKNVINYAYLILSGKETKDNFLNSVSLNKKMLKYLNT